MIDTVTVKNPGVFWEHNLPYTYTLPFYAKKCLIVVSYLGAGW